MSACDGPSISKPRNNDRTTEKQGKREMGRKREKEKNKRQKNKSNTETKFQNEKSKVGIKRKMNEGIS